ncbi:MAG: hypothetical protein JWP71_45 [Mucilaginibacter sp.]|nr:hypothetical protein [Mucilaginibacter sp.]
MAEKRTGAQIAEYLTGHPDQYADPRNYQVHEKNKRVLIVLAQILTSEYSSLPILLLIHVVYNLQLLHSLNLMHRF